jgi:AcrR family transcriptional regulator
VVAKFRIRAVSKHALAKALEVIVMTRRSRPGAKERTPLSRETVLHAAIVLADTGGIESLTMRKLGNELGVEAMSLYNHVDNKDDILNGILELVMAEIALPPSNTYWKRAIRETAISAHQVLLRHPWACSLMMEPNRASRSRLCWMEGVLRSLGEGGLSAELTHHAYHALDSHITGFTLWMVNLPAQGEELKKIAGTFLEAFPVEEFPYLVEHIEYHLMESDTDGENEFEFGLDLILDGLERIRDMG